MLADLGEVDVGSDALNAQQGTDVMRKAATGVYTRYLSHETVGNKCAEYLEKFFDDDSEDVRKKVVLSFADMSGTRLLELESFVRKFINSRSFESDSFYLLSALTESNTLLPSIVCHAAERILEFLGEEGTHFAYHNSMVASSISTLVVRQYEQSSDASLKVECLNLIDEMERIGYVGIADELRGCCKNPTAAQARAKSTDSRRPKQLYLMIRRCRATQKASIVAGRRPDGDFCNSL